jgi:hypothetical protein
MKSSTDRTHIQLIEKPGGRLNASYLDDGFILDKNFGVSLRKRTRDAGGEQGQRGKGRERVETLIFGSGIGGTSSLEGGELSMRSTESAE